MTSEEDLSLVSPHLFHFERDPTLDEGEIAELLAYPNRWTIAGRNGGCSCDFRHVMRGNYCEFNAPEDWMQEDPEAVESTSGLYDLFSRLLSEGQSLDVLDLWCDDTADYARTIKVSLAAVPRDAFQFFEGYRFDLVNES